MTDTSTLFPVLNLAKVKRHGETDRRLPTWLSKPTQFPAVNLVEFGQDIDELSDYIDDDIRLHLKKDMLIERLFPVQKSLIPCLTRQFRSRPFRRPNDICVSSPTGSGKTLAFAVPIINHLKQTLKRSLRTLVVLPSRDLAIQVHKTFNTICQPTHLRCALAVGDGPDAQKEFFRRVNPSKDSFDDEGSGLDDKQFSILHEQHSQPSERHEYVSTIDILVCTPGVLVDLMHNAAGFTLKDLEILVIDEADRLMTSHKHDWLNTVERSIFKDIRECACEDNTTNSSPINYFLNKSGRTCYTSMTGCAMMNVHKSQPIHKLLFSATLSSDPQLLMQMNLFQPRLFIATRPSITSTKIRNSLGSNQSTPRSSPMPNATPATVNTRSELLTSTAIPEQLEEKMFITESKEKLFVIWYMFHELKFRKVICFTNQLQTSFRLCKFLNEIHEVRAVEFSSNLKPELRQKYINEFKNGRVDVLVSTDLMARGMDVEGVDYVISYDMPSSEVFYVHRIGRTARAGRKGTAITLVDTKQLVLFKRIVQLAHKLPNSMRLGDVVEEIKTPLNIKKNPEKYDSYTKTLENYEDKLNQLAKRSKYAQHKTKE